MTSVDPATPALELAAALRRREVSSVELLDACLSVENALGLYAEYASRGVEFARALADTPWHSREFVVKDCDGRLLGFGANRE